MREINADSAPETRYVESDETVVQEFAGEQTIEEEPANTKSFTETFATGTIVGDADPNANNFIVSDGGKVKNVDSEGVVDISQDWAVDAIRTAVDDMFADMGYSTAEQAREEINNSIEDQVDELDPSELDENLPDSFIGNQIIENIEYVKDNDSIL